MQRYTKHNATRVYLICCCDNNNIIIVFPFISGEHMEIIIETYVLLIWYLIAKILL